MHIKKATHGVGDEEAVPHVCPAIELLEQTRVLAHKHKRRASTFFSCKIAVLLNGRGSGGCRSDFIGEHMPGAFLHERYGAEWGWEVLRNKKLLIGLGVIFVLWATGILGWIFPFDVLFNDYGSDEVVYSAGGTDMSPFVYFLYASVMNIFWIGIYALIPIFVIWGIVRAATRKGRTEKKAAEYRKASIDDLIATFGDSKEQRSSNINSTFDKKTAEIKFTLQRTWADWYLKVNLGRSLASMSARDREVLRSSLLLYNEGISSSPHNAFMQIFGIVYGDGKATIYEGWQKKGLDGKTIKQALDWLVEGEGLEQSVDFALTELNRAVEKHPDNPVVKALAARLLGNGGDLSGQGNLTPLAVNTLPENALILGHEANSPDKLLGFAGEGSLITVAPPGSGKTQCHVLPNLLTWNGPAVVLDIKGEIHAATSAWRAANVGPIFKFSPLDPDQGHSYNPLLAVSDEPDHIWEDSRFLADMLIVPSGKSKDPFWESRARDVLNAAIAITVRNNSPEERTMAPVLDILHGVGWDRFIISLQAATDVPTMARMGRSLGEMEPKTRDGVLQSALASMSAWEGARIARATQKSDWTPADLRSGKNPTIYICIKPNEIDSYASMLRVIIAQHIRALTSSLPDRGTAPILFILDELPRLRHMPPVEEALEIGRQYGIKLWMFTQSLGQLETAYENADGMVANCAVRCFMNPSLQDGTAQKLSDDMGYRESVVDGTRVKRVEPDVLAGPDFTSKVIVMASGATPTAVEKHFAYNDPELTRRANLESEISAAE